MPAPMKGIFTVEDARRRARRRVPRIAFDYLDGGAGTEATVARNGRAFGEVLLHQHFLRDVGDIDRKVTIFGKTFDEPFGFAPLGLLNLIWPQGDQAFARIAAARNMPMTLSTAATSSMEEIVEIAGENLWSQLYVSRDDAVTFDLIARAKTCGIGVLVVTVDVPTPSLRLRDLRNRFAMPFKLTPAMVADFARRPAWSRETLRHGAPGFRNMAPYMPARVPPRALAQFMGRQATSRLDGTMFARIREAWPGKLVVKGVMTAETMGAAIAGGADGIWISNHGGRQVDYAPATIEAIDAILVDGKPEVPVFLDSGVRCGGDVVKAFAKGADAVFAGRPFAFGLGAGGRAGVEHIVDLFVQEIDRALKQTGCPRLADIDASYVVRLPRSGAGERLRKA